MTTNTQPQTQQSGGDELQKKLQQDIRDMFKLEAQRNELNYALSGVERGEMTIQDYEDDLSLAISNWFVKDLLPAREREAEKRSRIDELEHYVTLHIDDKFSGHYKNGFMMAVQQFERHRDARLQQLQPKPQAGEGGEG